MKLAQYNEYLVSIVDTDFLVLKHQDISNHSAELASMRFYLFIGKRIVFYFKLYIQYGH